MISKYLDPKNDYAFKRIFGQEKNKDILIHFLNDMIVFENNATIIDVTFLKTIQDADLMAKKTSMVDVLCVDQNKNKYIVEMQVVKEKGFEKRAQYYAAKAYGEQLNRGEDYHTLCPVYFLAITDFIVFQKHESFKSDHIILENKSYQHYLKDFSFTFVELPKFTKSINHLESIVDKWCYFFKHADHTDENEIEKIVGTDKVILKAYEEVNQLGWSEDEKRTYDAALKQERDARAILDQKYDEGMEKGLVKGIEKGREEGERKAKIETARKMKEAGLSFSDISNFTGLSLEDLKTF